ncbi:DNA-protecting protein DprA [Cellulomonas rhizosphaerae]|uniref:DNA-protecting protein DprA n=2 Tax=Cellulomonas rhizosphaerae TaxID=2293719 RepID=A0A413RMN2_9CELL|nr:DNA-protecting protein DprA [Cellulomonas rhizosphaerae]
MGSGLDDRAARAAWSGLAEPGDLVAGALVATLGAVDALRLVVLATDVGVRAAWAEVTGEAPGGRDREQDGALWAVPEHVDARASTARPTTARPSTARPSTDPQRADALRVEAAPADSPRDDPRRVDPSRAHRAEQGAASWPGGVRLARAAERWGLRLRDAEPSRRLAALATLGGSFVVPGDPGWPVGLDDLGAAAPFGLWVRGEADLGALLARSVAIVGSRASTTYGERVAVDLAAGAVDARACVVSGGAYGIDAAAHRGALSRGGRTVVLLAGGVDRAYPAGNARIFEAAVGGGGALVAEVPPGSVPTKGRFLQRNRVIAAAARATVVVEAAWRSGAMSTAHHAARLLRPVGAVPGPVTSVASAGCHRLLREGSAVCVTDAAELMDLAGLVGSDLVPERVGPPRLADGLDPGVVRVLDALPRRMGVPVEDVAARAGVTLGEARAALGLLEFDGLAVRDGDRWRVRPN